MIKISIMITSIYTGFPVKRNTLNTFKMADPRWRMVPVPSYIINNVIATLLLLLKVINVLVNFLMLSYFLLYLSNLHFMVIEWNLDSPTN